MTTHEKSKSTKDQAREFRAELASLTDLQVLALRRIFDLNKEFCSNAELEQRQFMQGEASEMLVSADIYGYMDSDQRMLHMQQVNYFGKLLPLLYQMHDPEENNLQLKLA